MLHQIEKVLKKQSGFCLASKFYTLCTIFDAIIFKCAQCAVIFVPFDKQFVTKELTTNEIAMTTVKFYHFDSRDELYLGIAQVSVEILSGGGIETDVYFERVVNTETHEEIFPDEQSFPRDFRSALAASALECYDYSGMNARAEKLWAEYNAETVRTMVVSCHTVFLEKGKPAQTIIVYETRGRVVRYKLLSDAGDAPMRYASELPEPILEYLNWVAAGCPATQTELITA